MEKWLEILMLTGKVIWVQIQTVINPIIELIESSLNVFWFVFVLTVIAGYLLLGIINKGITFYHAHNFIHRKMAVESAQDIEFTIFIKSLWQKDPSKGLVANAKSAKSRYLQFNAQERLYVQSYLQHRLRFLRTNQPLFILGAVFIGLISSIAVEVLHLEAVQLTAENILKTTLFVLVWLFLMQSKYVSVKKQTYHHLAWLQETNRSATIDYIPEEDKVVSMEKENNPAY
ncbi:hypothetical protein [Fictibacillus barbaricus]|uniref:ABC transmembrane type-1 domain-containing protein n=1 Tax=Fictibacillus barbaricus TaxID=182136 RepID=A0ABS2ZGC6_9BACL|nr:hypothetical protein [Fictibacillus barbaricus]MBN3547237.1 hypothetical protein [Fictibacillus barbaricus]GGB47470.1 hypothetical protein GCM10007199_11180 [Fictibacillus barbaricus]